MNEQTQQLVRVRIEHALSEHKETTMNLYELIGKLGISQQLREVHGVEWNAIIRGFANTEADIRNALNKWDKGEQQ